MASVRRPTGILAADVAGYSRLMGTDEEGADRDEETIDKAAEGLRAAGHKAIGVTCDVTDTAQVEAIIERAVSTYGRLDAAFNNAGVNSEAAAFLDTSDDEFERVMNVNLRGVWNCMKGELRQMMAQGSGAIVNCSSIGVLKGSRGAALILRASTR
jgi:NAD(P)-dependent dehydrogenase (short-subunit alcohol dehydrogenase family)